MVPNVMQIIASSKKHLVLGLGKSGISCVRYLTHIGAHVEAADSREKPPGLEAFRAEFPNVPVRLGPFDAQYLATADDLVVSPGLSIRNPAIQQALEHGVALTGDVDIFSGVAAAPIIGITGSNGKSTVTTLLAEMAKRSGTRAAAGGNLGIPSLDLLNPKVELYILELSSFQLETTRRLSAMAATVLNVSADHLDRYTNLQEYHQAKHRIFRGCQTAVINDDDPLSQPLLHSNIREVHYGLNRPNLKKFSTVAEGEEVWLTFGFDKLVSTRAMKIRGRHNISNALAALALGHTAGLPMTAMIEALHHYPGLPHRCEWVRTVNQVTFINDSKGTNPGASINAITSFQSEAEGRLFIIAGGDGKGADFKDFGEAIDQYCAGAYLIGVDQAQIAKHVHQTPVTPCISLDVAVQHVYSRAKARDIVLFSPACASFDMFENFEERGEYFCELVRAL